MLVQPAASALLSVLALASLSSASSHGSPPKHWSRKHHSALARRAASAAVAPPASAVVGTGLLPSPDANNLAAGQLSAFEKRLGDGQAPGSVKRRAVQCKARPTTSARPTVSSAAPAVVATSSSSKASSAVTSASTSTKASSTAAASSSTKISSSSSSTSSKASTTSSATSSSTSTKASTSSSSSSSSTSSSSSSSSASKTTSSTPAATSTSASSSFLRGWTSSTSSSSEFSSLTPISLTSALSAEKGKAGPIGSAPDGKEALVATYPAGAIGGSSVWSYYSDYDPAVLQDATEVVLAYSVYLPSSFSWVKGGKLPGLFGGEPGQYGCSGGNQDTRNVCWSARLMWRADGAGEVYTYLPLTDGNTRACEASGDGAYCDDATYGLSFGRGNFKWNAGGWNTVEERVKLNDVGVANGEISLTVNSQPVISATALELITTPSAAFGGLFMSTFYGGSTSAWAPAAEQQAFFADFALGVLA